MSQYGIEEPANVPTLGQKQAQKFLALLVQTQKDLKEVRNTVSTQGISAQSSNLSSGSKETEGKSSQEYEQLKLKYNQTVIIHEEQKKEYEIRLAEKNEQIEILQKLLRSQYLKQVILQSNVKHLLKKRVENGVKGSEISENTKNSIILGVYNREEGSYFRNREKDETNIRLEDMLKQPSGSRTCSNRGSNIENNLNRVDKLKSSLVNLKGLKRYFGSDSKFKQDVLDV